MIRIILAVCLFTQNIYAVEPNQLDQMVRSTYDQQEQEFKSWFKEDVDAITQTFPNDRESQFKWLTFHTYLTKIIESEFQIAQITGQQSLKTHIGILGSNINFPGLNKYIANLNEILKAKTFQIQNLFVDLYLISSLQEKYGNNQDNYSKQLNSLFDNFPYLDIVNEPFTDVDGKKKPLSTLILKAYNNHSPNIDGFNNILNKFKEPVLSFYKQQVNFLRGYSIRAGKVIYGLSGDFSFFLRHEGLTSILRTQLKDLGPSYNYIEIENNLRNQLSIPTLKELLKSHSDSFLRWGISAASCLAGKAVLLATTLTQSFDNIAAKILAKDAVKLGATIGINSHEDLEISRQLNAKIITFNEVVTSGVQFLFCKRFGLTFKSAVLNPVNSAQAAQNLFREKISSIATNGLGNIIKSQVTNPAVLREAIKQSITSTILTWGGLSLSRHESPIEVITDKGAIAQLISSSISGFFFGIVLGDNLGSFWDKNWKATMFSFTIYMSTMVLSGQPFSVDDADFAIAFTFFLSNTRGIWLHSKKAIWAAKLANSITSNSGLNTTVSELFKFSISAVNSVFGTAVWDQSTKLIKNPVN